MRHIPYFILSLFLFSCSTPEKKASETSFALNSFPSPSGKNSSLPHLVKGDDNKLYLSWVETDTAGTATLFYARLNASDSWSEPELIASGNDWFVNWADYPMIAVNKRGDMIAHYLKKSAPATFSYDVHVVRKPANSSKWSSSIIPHRDSTQTEHGFVTALPQSDNTFLLSWLDGRNTGSSEDGHGHHGAMTIRTAKMNIDGTLTEESLLDEKTCDCCQTTGANTSDGPVILYRDRSEMEIRDIFITHSTSKGWTIPHPVHLDNWNIAGCPVNGPRADAIDNTLVVAWFTAANNKPEVKVAFSTDAGQSFSPPVSIDSNTPLGRVDAALIDPNNALVSWLTSENDQTIIKTMHVQKNGQRGETRIVTQTSDARASGFPQMAIHNGQAYFAWTDVQGNSSQIKMAKISL